MSKKSSSKRLFESQKQKFQITLEIYCVVACLLMKDFLKNFQRFLNLKTKILKQIFDFFEYIRTL